MGGVGDGGGWLVLGGWVGGWVGVGGWVVDEGGE